MAEPEKPSPTEPADWAEAQRQYWDAWMNVALQALARTGDKAASPGNWSEALGRWWETTAPAYPQADAELLNKLIPQGQGFLLLGEQIVKLSQALQASAQTGGDWQDALNKAFDNIRETFFQPFEGGDAAHPALAAFWGLPVDTWQRVASSLSMFPGDALQALRGENYRPATALGESVDKTLGMPALGYTREWQEQAQQAVRLWLDYQETHREYVELMHGAANRSLALLQKKLAERVETERPLQNLRECYNLWVDCNEEAYAETVRSPEFSRAQGHMINALMRFKRHGQRMVDETLSALNIPNRIELDTAHARAQDTRRRLKKLEDQMEAVQTDKTGRLISALQKDIKALREELSTERLMTGLQDDIKALREELNTLKGGESAEKAEKTEKKTAKKTTSRRRAASTRSKTKSTEAEK